MIQITSIIAMNPTIKKSINASKILSKHIFNNVPTALQVRGHVGYHPAAGRLHPWDTEDARLQKQVIQSPGN